MIIEELHEKHQKYILSNKNYTILLGNKHNEYYFIRKNSQYWEYR